MTKEKDEYRWWSGRPQDDPALIAAREEALTASRADHPPIDCWIDSVAKVDLYLAGTRRATVDRGTAQITVFEGEGNAAGITIYLRSENPYDVAEAQLGISRVAEVRDESIDAMDIISSLPRDREDAEAAAFRSAHGPEDEIFRYMRSAAGTLAQDADRAGLREAVLDPLLDAIVLAVQERYEAALARLRDAAAGMAEHEGELIAGSAILADCRRAVLATERHLARQDRPPAGKGGG